jgi:hypothetical protein
VSTWYDFVISKPMLCCLLHGIKALKRLVPSDHVQMTLQI